MKIVAFIEETNVIEKILRSPQVCGKSRSPVHRR
jgi:hypothetical protein